VNTLAPIVIEQIMRDHMDRASDYRRAHPVKAGRERAPSRPRVRRAFGALVGRLAA